MIFCSLTQDEKLYTFNDVFNLASISGLSGSKVMIFFKFPMFLSLDKISADSAEQKHVVMREWLRQNSRL